MNTSSTAKGLTVLLLVGLISFLAWDNTQEAVPVKARFLSGYQTSSTRTNNVQTNCPANLDRTTLVSSGDVSSAQNLMSNIHLQLGIDGNTIMYKLANSNMGGALSMITGNMMNIVMFIGVFLVPFVIFLLLWPFLCCCCCCPASCPSKCCQKRADSPYTKCQLYWPSVTLVLALLLIISVSSYGLVNSSNVGPTFKNMACSLAIFTDDLLNGNVTTSATSFFTGLNIFSNSLTNLSGNLTNIKTTLTDLSDTLSGNTFTQVNNIIAVETGYIKLIPDVSGNIQMNLLYNTPINQTAPTGTLTSSFASLLGTWNTANTLVYNLYASVYYAHQLMQGIKNNSNSFSSQTTTIQNQTASMQTTLSSLISNINDMDSGLSSFLSLLNLPGSYGNMGMQAFYSFLIGFSSFALLGVICTTCCGKPGCRNLMYFSCIFLFIGAIIAFMVSVFFSAVVPLFTWTCQYLNVAVASSTGFQTNFGAFLSNTTLNQITVCMPYGDGNIINTIAGSAANGLNNLTSVINSINTFNNVTLQSWINTNLSALVTMTNSYANGDISDLDTANNNILAGFSNPNNVTINTGCTGFTDSWVPSNNQNTSYSTAIPCQSGAGTTGELSNCNANFGPNGVCQGCMDTTQLLTQYVSAATVLTAANTKYPASCAFATILSNTWTNYFSKKYSTLGFPTVKTQVVGSVMYRMQQAQNQINNTGLSTSVFYNIDTFRSVLNTANTDLSTIQNLTDPTYGMLAGLNCQLFGQDFVTFKNVMCGSLYNNVYIIRLTFGIAAWGILFALCCTVCSGVRHFKQIGKINGNQVSDLGTSNIKNSFDESPKRLQRGKNKRRQDD